MQRDETHSRRNNHPDQHTRNANDAKAAELIAARTRHEANAREWIRRSLAALDAGNAELASNLFRQAHIEIGGANAV